MNQEFDWLISDVDGILTDGGHYYTAEGKLMKKFGSNDKDALKKLNELYVKEIVFITADKLGYSISCKRIKRDWGLNLKLIPIDKRNDFFKQLKGKKIYIGDGIHDAEDFEGIDLSFALNNSTPQAKKNASVVLDTSSGNNVFPYLLEFLGRRKLKIEKPTESEETLDASELYRMLKQINLIPEKRQEINRFCNSIKNSYTEKNKIVLCGVGKNALLANLICEFLYPYNITSVVLDPHRALHGNLGLLEKDDILIMTSKSGNTAELVHLMKCLQNKGDIENKFLLTCNKDCELAKYDIKCILSVPVSDEVSRFNHSPQTTFVVFAIILFLVVNALANTKEMTQIDYLLNHQAGEIGKVLRNER